MAADVVFPKPAAGTIGDLSSAASWGLDEVPAATDRVKMSDTMTVTASNDIDFAGMLFTGTSKTFTLDMRDEVTGGSPRKINLTGTMLAGPQKTNCNKNTWYMKGGFWDFNNKSLQIFYDGNSYGNASDNKLYISDGAVITNLYALRCGYGDSRQLIQLSGQSRVHAKYCDTGHYQFYSCRIEITDGSKYFVKNTADDSGNPGVSTGRGGGGDNDGIFVSGEGSCLTADVKYAGFGQNTGGKNFLTVTDHADVYIKTSSGIYCSGAAKDSVAISVSDGGRLRLGGTFYLGQAKGCGGGKLQILEGGYYTGSAPHIGGNSSDGGHDWGLIVSNGTYQAAIPDIGECGGSSNCYVRLQGPTANYDVSSSLKSSSEIVLFRAGAPRCRYEILDDAVWSTGDYSCEMRMGAQGSKGRHTFLVDNGSFIGTNVMFALANINYASVSNVLRVQNGGRFFAKQLLSYSRGNTFAVSNGTIEVRNSISVNGKSNSQYIGAQSNNWFVVEGDSPRVICGNGFSAPQASYVKFAIPANGYQPGIVPITVATNFTVSADSHLLAEGLEERLANIEATERITLATAGNKMTVPQAVLDEANALLPEKCKFYVEGKNLMLKAWKPSGFTLIVR